MKKGSFNKFHSDTFLSGSCSSEYLFISLNGRAWNERGFVAGFYQKIVNSTTFYWLKEEDEVPTAIWFSQSHGKWIVGRLDDLGGTAGYLFSSVSTICPDSPGIEWTYGDGTGEFTIARNTINVSKWTEGEKSFGNQLTMPHLLHSTSD